MDFQWTALRCFREAARHKSMRKAADALAVSPSSVHRQLVKLEAQVGSTLFERSSDGVRLTAAGEVFYHYVQRAHHDLDRMLSEIDDLRGIRKGHVRVACEEGLGKDFLPGVLTPYRARYPGVRFSVTILDMPGIVEGVLREQFDIGIAFNPQTHAGLKRHAHVTVAVGAVMLPAHRLAARRKLRLADLVGEALIVAGTGFTIRNMLDVQAGSSRKHLDIAAESNSFEAITALVKSGAGVAIRTMVGIREEVARGEVVFVPISEPGFHMETVSIITCGGRPAPVPAAIFAEHLVAALPELKG
jgi:DNA-binding transcriptional LysR family regulator